MIKTQLFVSFQATDKKGQTKTGNAVMGYNADLNDLDKINEIQDAIAKQQDYLSVVITNFKRMEGDFE